MSSWEYFPCLWCGEGKFLVNIPSNYDGNPPVRTVCRNPKCREKEKLYLESSEAGKKRKEKIARIEREINQNNENLAEIKRKMEKAAKNRQEQEAQIDQEISRSFPKVYCSQCSEEIATGTYYQSPDNPQKKYCQICVEKMINDNTSNDQQFGKCEYCKKSFREGEKYIYFPQDPQQRKICISCQPQLDNEIWATQQIAQGKEVDLDSLNVHPESRIALKSLQQIMKGQKVDIDRLPIDEESKQQLRMAEQLIKAQQISSLPSPQIDFGQLPDSEEFLIKCLSCHRQYQLDYKVPVCLYCQSPQVENWKGEFLQPKPLTQVDARQQISFRCSTCQKPIKQGEEYAKTYYQGNPQPQTSCVSCAKRLEKQLNQPKTVNSQQSQLNSATETQKWKIIAFTCVSACLGLGLGLALYYFFAKKSVQPKVKD